jgi:hypothetical protein
MDILSWRIASSGLWRSVDLVWTDFSEEHVASIFREEKSAKEEPAWAGGYQTDNGMKWFYFPSNSLQVLYV